MRTYLLLLTIIVLLPMRLYAHGNYSRITHLSNRELLKHGDIFQTKELFDSALFYYSILNNRYSKDMPVEDKWICAKSMSDAGLLYYYKSNYSTAMELLLKGLEIAESNDFEDVMCDVYKNIGNVYSTFADFDRSCTLYEKAYALAEKLDDIEQKNRILNNLVGAYCFINKLDKAKKYYALLLKAPDKSVRYQYDVMLLKCLILYSEQHLKEAAMGYRGVKDYVEVNKMDIRCLGTVNSCLGKVYEAENRLDSAIYFYRSNEIEARRAGQMDLLVETLRDLANAFEKKGDIRKSLTYKSEYMELSDSMFNLREFNSVKNAQFKYDMDKSSALINDLQDGQRDSALKIAMQRNVLWIVSVGFAVVVLLLVVVYWQKRKLGMAYNALFNRNREYVESEKHYKLHISELEAKLSSQKDNEESSPKVSLVKGEQRAKILSDIQSVMDNNPVVYSSDFSIEMLADLIGSNTRYISDIINDEFHKNFRSFVNDYRIKEAMVRQADKERCGHLTIKAIAESLGYNSQPNFISAFTRVTGIKPSVYQKISRERADNKQK